MEAIGKLTDRFVRAYAQENQFTENEKAWLKYGIEKRITTLTVFVPAYALAIILAGFWCATAFFAAFYFIRSRANGYHAKTPAACFVQSLLLETAFLLGSRWIVSEVSVVLIYGIGAAVILLLAPFNHPNMNYSVEEIRALKSSLIYRMLIATGVFAVAYLARWFDFTKGLSAGIAMAALLLCLAYILEWRSSHERN